jgi:hypothetical protein
MRFVTLGFGIATVLVAATASAAPSKGDTGGKGGNGPDSSLKSGAEGSASEPSAVDITEVQYRNKSTQNPDEVMQKRQVEKPWEVSASYELHRLIRQEDVSGAPKLFQLIGISGRYSLTENDIVSIFGGASEGFIADPQESGVRANDISLQYAHTFALPQKFRLRASVGATVPISYYSQLASNITTPSLSVGLSRKFGDLSVSAMIRGAYYIDRYRTAAALGSSSSDPGGATNSRAVASALLSAEYMMPFHRPLSVGVAVSDAYYWYYSPGTPPAGTPSYGVVSDQYFGETQPMQQSYGGELFARYVMPDLAGIKSDFTVAIGNSSPNFVLHDGIVHPYLLYRDTAEVYFALGGRY